MYCPSCFNNTLELKSRGVVKLTFNGKAKNTSLFTYNLSSESKEVLLSKLREKIVEYFKFYSQFNHKSPLKIFECFTTDASCSNGCKISFDINKVSLINIVFEESEVYEILREEGIKYKIPVEL